MKLLKSIDLALSKKLKDKGYRNAFFEEWANDEVAGQIRRLRNLRKLRQVDVAKETGMEQSAISRLEQSEYSRWNFTTLLRIAQALDARVRVTFEPAEDVIRHYESTERRTKSGTSAISARQAAVEEAINTIRVAKPREAGAGPAQYHGQKEIRPRFRALLEKEGLRR